MSWLDLDTIPAMFDRGAYHWEDEIRPYPAREWYPDSHRDADRWLAGDQAVRDAIQLEVEFRPAKVSEAPSPRKKYKDPILGRQLPRISGKLRELKSQIVELSRYFSDRAIARKLSVSRATVARAKGADWARDKRVGRAR